MSVGWAGHRRVYGCVLHLDIINEKIWIQHNTTEIQIGQELVAIGIPIDIILGFQAPYLRKYTAERCRIKSYLFINVGANLLNSKVGTSAREKYYSVS